MDVSVVFINRGVLSIYFLHHPSEHPDGELEEHSGKLTLGAHAQRGYCTWSVCLFVCLFVCLSTTILALQATRRFMSELQCYKGKKNDVVILLKRLRSIARDMA